MASNELRDPNEGKGKQPATAKDSAAAERSRVLAPRGLDSRSQEAIGRALKAHFDDLLRAPVPDKFMELLDRLEAKEQSTNSRSESE